MFIFFILLIFCKPKSTLNSISTDEGFFGCQAGKPAIFDPSIYDKYKYNHLVKLIPKGKKFYRIKCPMGSLCIKPSGKDYKLGFCEPKEKFGVYWHIDHTKDKQEIYNKDAKDRCLDTFANVDSQQRDTTIPRNKRILKRMKLSNCLPSKKMWHVSDRYEYPRSTPRNRSYEEEKERIYKKDFPEEENLQKEKENTENFENTSSIESLNTTPIEKKENPEMISYLESPEKPFKKEKKSLFRPLKKKIRKFFSNFFPKKIRRDESSSEESDENKNILSKENTLSNLFKKEIDDYSPESLKFQSENEEKEKSQFSPLSRSAIAKLKAMQKTLLDFLLRRSLSEINRVLELNEELAIPEPYEKIDLNLDFENPKKVTKFQIVTPFPEKVANEVTQPISTQKSVYLSPKAPTDSINTPNLTQNYNLQSSSSSIIKPLENPTQNLQNSQKTILIVQDKPKAVNLPNTSEKTQPSQSSQSTAKLLNPQPTSPEYFSPKLEQSKNENDLKNKEQGVKNKTDDIAKTFEGLLVDTINNQTDQKNEENKLLKKEAEKINNDFWNALLELLRFKLKKNDETSQEKKAK